MSRQLEELRAELQRAEQEAVRMLEKHGEGSQELIDAEQRAWTARRQFQERETYEFIASKQGVRGGG